MIEIVKQILRGRFVSILVLLGPALFQLFEEKDLLDAPYHSEVRVCKVAEWSAGVRGTGSLQRLLQEATHHLQVNTNEQGPSPSALVHVYHTNLPMKQITITMS